MIDVNDWSHIEATFPYVAAMKGCIQDRIFHGEGDVWTHTKMVADALQHFDDDRIMRLTALFHDVHKPETRTVEWDVKQQRERISHPNHSSRGAQTAWFDLWLADEPLDNRLAVYWLCRWHQRIFHIWHANDMLRDALTFACVGSWAKLINFARADTTGRICETAASTMDDLALLDEFVTEHSIGTAGSPAIFQMPYDRLYYFEKPHRSPYYKAQEPVSSRVTILSGLPGVGKDYHCRTMLQGLPVVSLDAIRNRLHIDPSDNQGRVIQAAFEEARVFLRQRLPFVWNAQTVTRLARNKIIGLCRDYDAYVTIHAFDRPLKTILHQNQQRDRQVPESVILSAARKWEPPSLLEAHEVTWV